MRWSAFLHTRFHVSGATLDTPRLYSDFAYGPLTLFGRLFHTVPLSLYMPYRSPYPLPINRKCLGCSPFARHYLGNRFRFLLLCLLRCFTSAGLARLHYLFMQTRLSTILAGFPHSDISGLKPACGSPKLFAACHVLLRHVSPRHPPVALLLFITKHCSFFKIGLLALGSFALVF